MRRLKFLACLTFVLASVSAHAMVGNSPSAVVQGRHAVMIVGARGTVCTGAAIAPDLVLTAGHCTVSGNNYQVVESRGVLSSKVDVVRVRAHPNFSLQTMLAHRATADVALMKLSRPLSDGIVPATLAPGARIAQPGNRFTVTGYGLADEDDDATLGTLRAAQLVATGSPSSLQLRLVDPATRGARPGKGACTGDSGAPVYEGTALIGVVSWSTGPNLGEGCGGLTGVTPIGLYRQWIIDEARRLGSPLAP